MLQAPGIGDGRPVGGILILVLGCLEGVDPESFAVKDMHHLCAKRWETEAWKFFHVLLFGERREVIEHKSEAGIRPAMQLADSDESEQEQPPFGSDSL